MLHTYIGNYHHTVVLACESCDVFYSPNYISLPQVYTFPLPNPKKLKEIPTDVSEGSAPVITEWRCKYFVYTRPFSLSLSLSLSLYFPSTGQSNTVLHKHSLQCHHASLCQVSPSYLSTALEMTTESVT